MNPRPTAKEVAQAAIRSGALRPADMWPGTPETSKIKFPHEVGLQALRPAPKRTIYTKKHQPISGKKLFAKVKKGGRLLWIKSPA